MKIDFTELSYDDKVEIGYIIQDASQGMEHEDRRAVYVPVGDFGGWSSDPADIEGRYYEIEFSLYKTYSGWSTQIDNIWIEEA